MVVTARNALVNIADEPNRELARIALDAQEGIAAAFDREFSCINADDSAMRLQAYKIRYHVYCIERKYEDPDKSAAGIETDEFDLHAPHKLLFHRKSGRFAGVVRLILPTEQDGFYKLPFVRCVGAGMIADTVLPVSRTAEASRFAISRNFREHLRTGTAKSAHDEANPGFRELLCNPSIGLVRAAFEMAAEHGVTHLCAIMEPALLRLLSRLGVHFKPIGPKIEHHGWRQPCYADIDRLLARTWTERYDIWEILSDRGRAWPLSIESVRHSRAAPWP